MTLLWSPHCSLQLGSYGVSLGFPSKNLLSSLDNVPGPSPQSIDLDRKLHGWAFHSHIAHTYGGVVRIDGPMRSKILYVFDSLALHHIIVKDQPIYARNGTDLLYVVFKPIIQEHLSLTLLSRSVSKLMFGEGLLSVSSGAQHRNNVHMRRLAPVFYAVAHKLRAGLTSRVINGSAEVDILRWMNRCALELIGHGGLGYSFDNLADDPGQSAHPYSRAISGIHPLIMQFSLAFRFILPWAGKIGSARFQRAVVDWVPWHDFRDIVDIMDYMTQQIFDARKSALSSGEAKSDGGKDIMSILMQENARAEDEDRLPDAEVVGQMSTLIFAASETTSTTLARILYLLAQNPDWQDRLRAELAEAQPKDGTDMPYDQLMQLPVLDAVCRETLRLHPPSPFSLRPSQTPSSPSRHHSGRDDATIHAIRVPCGTDLMLSIRSANCATSIWGPGAAEWKPARWLEPLPDSVIGAPVTGVYQHLFTFGEGPCACIGFKFFQFELKVVLAVVLSAFRVSLPQKEIVWNLGFIVQPSVDGSEDTQLPLILTLL
ncbi:cytochrome P450 [Mycena olivaceomarginata]|nr:cytochrome P450 [Mycena olivaceomarginata]